MSVQGCSLGAALHGGALMTAPGAGLGASGAAEFGALAHVPRDLAVGFASRVQFLRTPAGGDLFLLRTALVLGYARLPTPTGGPLGAEVLARVECESTETGFGFLPGLSVALPVRLLRRAAPGEGASLVGAWWALVPAAQVSVPVAPSGLLAARGVELSVSVGLRLHLTTALWP